MMHRELLDDNAIRERLKELEDPQSKDRSAKFQELCESLWNGLDHGTQLNVHDVDAFTALLMNEDDLLLAELVIPELRKDARTTPDNELKLRIISHTATARKRSWQNRSMNWEELDRRQPLYRAEKDALQEGEMHRAGVLVFNNGTINKDQRDALRTWLAAYPRASPPPLAFPSHAQPENNGNTDSPEN
jgi:hypothetical protein